jgi:hypothetical protein
MFSGKSQFGMDKALELLNIEGLRRTVASVASAESAILTENGATQARAGQDGGVYVVKVPRLAHGQT